MTPFTANVVAIIRRIPAGRVMTYGQIARLAGSQQGARQVVRILHSMSAGYGLPWHRVVNRVGKLSLMDDEQVLLLRLEGVDVRDNAVDLKLYLYVPTEPPGEP